jgi:hypothetical protein
MSKALVATMAVGCMLLCTLLWAADSGGNRAMRAPQSAQPQEAQGPYANSRVLVEAFVVKVDLPALYEMGVSPLGERPQSVTVQHILKYLKARNNAGILAGAKVAVRNGEKSETAGQQTAYHETRHTDKGGASARSFTPYDSGETFTANARVVSEGVIAVGYSFNLSTFFIERGAQTESQDDQVPPRKAHWSWSGDATLEAGRPIIAGSTQEDDSVIFLILVAHLESQVNG